MTKRSIIVIVLAFVVCFAAIGVATTLVLKDSAKKAEEVTAAYKADLAVLEKDLNELQASVDEKELALKALIKAAEAKEAEDIKNLDTALKAEIKTVSDAQKADATAIEALKTRATTIEGEINALKTRVTATESDIAALKTRMTTAEADIATLKSEVEKLKEEDQKIYTTINNFKDEVKATWEAYNGKVATLEKMAYVYQLSMYYTSMLPKYVAGLDKAYGADKVLEAYGKTVATMKEKNESIYKNEALATYEQGQAYIILLAVANDAGAANAKAAYDEFVLRLQNLFNEYAFAVKAETTADYLKSKESGYLNGATDTTAFLNAFKSAAYNPEDYFDDPDTTAKNEYEDVQKTLDFGAKVKAYYDSQVTLLDTLKKNADNYVEITAKCNGAIDSLTTKAADIDDNGFIAEQLKSLIPVSDYAVTTDTSTTLSTDKTDIDNLMLVVDYENALQKKYKETKKTINDDEDLLPANDEYLKNVASDILTKKEAIETNGSKKTLVVPAPDTTANVNTMFDKVLSGIEILNNADEGIVINKTAVDYAHDTWKTWFLANHVNNHVGTTPVSDGDKAYNEFADQLDEIKNRYNTYSYTLPTEIEYDPYVEFIDSVLTIAQIREQYLEVYNVEVIDARDVVENRYKELEAAWMAELDAKYTAAEGADSLVKLLDADKALAVSQTAKDEIENVKISYISFIHKAQTSIQMQSLYEEAKAKSTAILVADAKAEACKALDAYVKIETNVPTDANTGVADVVTAEKAKINDTTVDTYTKVQEALTAAELAVDVKVDKNQAKATLATYGGAIDPAYNDGISALVTAQEALIDDVDNDTVEEVATALEAAKLAVDVKAAKNKAKADLDTFAQGKSGLNTEVATGKTAIDNADNNTLQKVANAFEAAKLVIAKVDAKAQLDAYVADETNVPTTYNAGVAGIVNDQKTNIDNCTTLNEVEGALNIAKIAVDDRVVLNTNRPTYISNLAGAQTTKKSGLTSPQAKAVVDELYNYWEAQINAAETDDDACAKYQEGVAAINAVSDPS